jgi:hypothetical protein
MRLVKNKARLQEWGNSPHSFFVSCMEGTLGTYRIRSSMEKHFE